MQSLDDGAVNHGSAEVSVGVARMAADEKIIGTTLHIPGVIPDGPLSVRTAYEPRVSCMTVTKF